jgi:hypothetical protein
MIRNPVRRLISAFKLFNAYHNLQLNSKESEQELMRHVAEESGWLKAQDRYNDYESTINMYRRFYPDLLCLPYDYILDQPEVFRVRLEDYLERPLDTEKFYKLTSSRINQIGESMSLSKSSESILTKRYKTSTAYIKNLFNNDIKL